jgi:hypothetical protein
VFEVYTECMNDNLCVAGVQRIKAQCGLGLVAVVEGPKYSISSGPQVHLELYYKYGHWSIAEGWSRYIDEALEELEEMYTRDGCSGEWEDMTADEQEDMALEMSEEKVRDQKGWGVVLSVPGKLIAQADEF